MSKLTPSADSGWWWARRTIKCQINVKWFNFDIQVSRKLSFSRQWH